ncbi:hypothetical protein [Actinophytocola oryzae]|uniref:Uncharacterized protein n=1 Tax=Actinophytocola oryzae TaxID=502181 RepID=A0A4R7UYZ4_9PSEU|nr:hypothetical protein [Actinophytocola oryzae]TDV42153.1 hypothetical protein CLV71_11823 [Actinophytocola oryzae]
MIEDRLAEEFRSAVTGEPPLGFDPDDVVTEAAHRRRRRLAAGATAFATGGVALAAAAVFATSGMAGSSDVRVGAGPSGSVVSTTPPGEGKPAESMPPSTPPTFPGSDEVVANLGQVIPAVLHDRVPGLEFTEPDSGPLMVVDGRRGVGGAYLVSGTTHRYVTVFVYHDKDTLDLVGDPAASGGWGPLLSDTPQQDGSHLRVYGLGGGDSQGLTVLHLRTDGVIVQADTTAKPEPGQNGLAVSQEVLTAVATDPRLTF